MAVQRTLIGNIKGPKGDKGDTGDTGARGAGATVTIGSVTTTAYGGNARVTNSGTTTDAVFDFVLPQGAPGEMVTDMENLTLSSMTQPSVQFPTPSIGDDGKTLFGKITKWFSDMRALVNTKLNTANVVNNLTTTEAGYALDARQGRLLGARGANTTSSFSAELSATGNNVTLGSIQVPSAGYSYLVLTYMRLNQSLNVVYNHSLSGRIVRTSAMNGGGSINYCVVAAGSTLAVQGYLPSGSCTALVDYNCIRLT